MKKYKVSYDVIGCVCEHEVCADSVASAKKTFWDGLYEKFSGKIPKNYYEVIDVVEV